ncbi:annexin A13-like [Planococcus citri]|uniref:annexin A13-like n=1 Tax=Planococcus citri TaxID=170843 RepID=UPI0031F9925C
MTREVRNISDTLQLYSSVSIFAIFAYLITHLLLNSASISGTPTIKPYDKFDLEKDIEKLHEVAKKVPNRAPDGDTMVRMVCHRTRDQRMQMKKAFKDKFDQDIASYCGGAADGEISLEDLLVDCFTSVLEIYVFHFYWELDYMFKSIDKHSLVEILLSVPPQEKEKFVSIYNETYRITPDQHVKDKVKDPEVHDLILRMLSKNRKPDITPDKIDWELAKKEATILNEGRKKWKETPEELERILLETPIQQLNATFVEFQKVNGKEIDEVMKKKLGRDLRECYKAMVHFVKDKYDYYAGRLHYAMKGCGTQDHVLNRIVSIHCEDDLKEIATAFQLNTADSLIDAIAADTTLHHEMLLTCLAGKHTVKEC